MIPELLSLKLLAKGSIGSGTFALDLEMPFNQEGETMENCTEHHHCFHKTVQCVVAIAAAVVTVSVIAANFKKLSGILHSVTKPEVK